MGTPHHDKISCTPKSTNCASSTSHVSNIYPKPELQSTLSNIVDHHRKHDHKRRFCFFSSLQKIVLITTISVVITSIAITTTLICLRIKPNKQYKIIYCINLSTFEISCIVAPSVLRWNVNGITIAGNGTAGIESNQLRQPWDLFVDWSNTLYITDRYNHRVQKYFMGNRNGVTVAGQASGVPGQNLTDFNQCTGIYVDEKNNMFISDMINERIMFWSQDASTGWIFFGQTDVAGSSTTLLNFPHNIERDLNSGTFYVTEYNNNRVMAFQYGLPWSKVVAGGNGAGPNYNQLWTPIASYFDSLTNSLLIATYGTHRIARWILGANNWTLVAGSINGAYGSNSAQFWGPTDVMLDPMGNMYVSDRFNHRIQFFLPNESMGKTILGTTGISGSNSTLLNNPCSLALDGQLNLYVTDQYNNRVQKFLRY